MQKYNKGYQFRLLPNSRQRQLFSRTFGSVRFIYNKLLADSIKNYNDSGKYIVDTPAQYKKENEWLKEVDSLALANAQLNLKKAMAAFFAENSKFPRFKSKRDTRQTYTTNNQTASNAIRIEGNCIRLPKIGLVRFIQHRRLKDGGIIKNCTVTKAPSGNYYISINVEWYRNIELIKISKEKILGLDFLMSGLYIDSEGEIANYPQYYRRAEQKLMKLSKEVSRKVKGSNNRYKARLKIAKHHETTSNMRKDFLHRLSYELAEKYDAIVIEDLNMKAMSQALNFGKSVSDNGWGKFTTMLNYKLDDRGKKLIKIDKWFASSKTCSVCGFVKKELKLSDKIYNCHNCGTSKNRDLNAAINIKTAGAAELA